nr:lysophospholipid acyltransferase family protein [Membranihabitans maritimus]
MAFSLIYTISLFPVSFIKMTFGKTFYFLTYQIFKYRYGVIIQNLSRALPDKSYGEIKIIARNYYKHLSDITIEILKLCSIRQNQLEDRMKIQNPDLLQRYCSRNENVIILLGHYGNWEYLNIVPALLPGIKMNAIYKPLSSPVMEKIFCRVRSRFGMNLITVKEAPRYLIQQKNSAQLTFFISDQYPGKNAKHESNFMHQSTLTFTGAEKLAKFTNAVVLYAEISKSAENKWAVIFHPITEHAAETRIQEITSSFNKKLQSTIEEEPAYWLWSHKRWK